MHTQTPRQNPARSARAGASRRAFPRSRSSCGAPSLAPEGTEEHHGHREGTGLRCQGFRVIETWNLPCWKGPTRIVQSNSRPCTDTPTTPPWASLAALSKRPWSSGSLGAVPIHSLGSLGSAQHPLGEEPFPDTQPKPPLINLTLNLP